MFRAVAALVAAFLVCAAAPAAAQEEPVHLRVTAVFDRPAYVSTDKDIRFTLTVENIGTVTADDVSVYVETDLWFDRADLGPLGDMENPVRLAPGERTSAEVPVELGMTLPDVLRVHMEAMTTAQWTVGEDREFTLEAPMTALRGSVSGLVYGDADGDGAADPGEGLVGGTVEVMGGFPFAMTTVRAGTDGVFTLDDLPAGDYTVNASVPRGWRVADPWERQLAEGANTWTVRAVRDLPPELTATITLDRDTYAAGDRAGQRVVLTNTGKTELSRITAACGAEDNYGLSSDSWGDLAWDGAGVTLAPGETRTWDFTEEIPASTTEFGFVVLDCSFHVDGVAGPRAVDRARVPGLTGTLGVRLCEEVVDPCVPVPGLTVLLMDNDTGKSVARATSDAEGRLRFTDAPAGRYEVRFLGPWQHADTLTRNLQVRGGKTVERVIPLVPGPSVADPDATTTPAPTTAAPTPMPRPTPVTALADTGVDAGGTLAVGLLLLLSGAGLLCVRRRHRDVC